MSRRPDPEEAAKLQYELEHTSPSRNKSVVPYLVLLVGVAFLLLGMAYLQQRRVNSETTDALKQSTSAVQSIQNLIAENGLLQDRVDQLEEQLNQVTQELEDARTGPAAQAAKNREAVLFHFTMLEQALRDKDYDIAASHARALCSGEYDLDLGMASETESFSPAQRLEEVIPLLEKKKALEKGEIQIPK